MQWSASDSPDSYVITPGSGTVNAGGNQPVTVNNITDSVIVTITAPNAANSPQQVTVNCHLP